MSEQWKPIPGYEGSYEASSLGNIRSIDRIVALRPSRTRDVRGFTQSLRGRVLKPYHAANGYLTVVLKSVGVGRTYNVHRLVALSFLGEPEETMHVNHIDGDKLNNAVRNLQWVTPQQNRAHADALALFTPARGSKAGSARLTEDDVRAIRKLLAEGFSQRKVAMMYGVGQRTIGHINTGHNWKHVA